MKARSAVALTGDPRRVTVVIPCYNYGHYLPQSVGSALAQPGLDMEVIVVDDASTDGSHEIASELARADRRVRVIKHATNRGHIGTYNDGLDAASGEFVALLSADDVLADAALTRAVALFAAEPNVGLVYGRPIRFGKQPPPATRTDVDSWRIWDGFEWARAVYRNGRNALLSPEAVLRTEVQRKVGGYNAEQPHAGDLAMWLRVAAVTDIGYIAGPTQALYREHDANMHSTVFAADQARGMLTDLRGRLLAFESAADGFNDGQVLHAAARRALAAEALDLASRAYVWGLTETWPVTELAAFAVEVFPAAMTLREWRAYVRRRGCGLRLSRRNPAFVCRELLLQRRRRLEHRRWTQIGV